VISNDVMSHDLVDPVAADGLAGIPVDRRHWIGGERVSGSHAEIELLSPIDGSSLGAIAAGGPTEVAAAVAAARDAFPAWAALGPGRRATLLRRFAQGILDHRRELSTVETADNGSLLGGNLKRVVDRAAHNIGFFADHAVALAERSASPLAGPVVDNHVRYEPAGVAALVTPWNAPMMLSTWKLGPALAAGDTVVLKPPEWAPLSCSLLADVAHEAGLPPGVLNVVQGAGDVAGQALVEHPEVDRISFTGSTTTGRVVGAAAAASITPVSLELGGKSPFVVFADADLDAAAATVAQQFTNAGQVCLAGTRLLVERSVAATFQHRVLAACSDATVGDPRQRGVRVGPLIHPRQLARVDGYVSRALAEGAHALIGGGLHPRGGLYYQPTILDGMAPGAEIVTDEVFGPVLTWQTFGTESEALELANATRYGLAAVVFTRDRSRAERIAAGIVAGTVWVNCYFVRDLAAPFGGARRSGVGREGGTWSFDFFCDVKNVALRRGSFTAAPADDLAGGDVLADGDGSGARPADGTGTGSRPGEHSGPADRPTVGDGGPGVGPGDGVGPGARAEGTSPATTGHATGALATTTTGAPAHPAAVAEGDPRQRLLQRPHQLGRERRAPGPDVAQRLRVALGEVGIAQQPPGLGRHGGQARPGGVGDG
jgi:acyl-CoA reductase-like NAD-dependent aldehyde dehydrogenase